MKKLFAQVVTQVKVSLVGPAVGVLLGALAAGLLTWTPHTWADPEKGSPAPVLEPLAPITQDTKTEIKFLVKAKPTKAVPLRFTIARLIKDSQVCPVPTNMKLTPNKGLFSWTPTPSQAGRYVLRVAVTDTNEKVASTSVRLAIRPRGVCSAQGPVGDALRKWYAAGTAAGNTGDFYDNRDRDHSPLDMSPYPQLDQITYTPEQRHKRMDWAAAQVLPPEVVFGNSSTSAPVLSGGSNVRLYYTHPRGMDFLYQQYRKNNLYMYPAHHDHHPGHNGKPFYGDVYPANSPYLITSQGSSGTDQPFMRAVPFTLAAFRPEVKNKLIQAGMLMPTVQMIFRSSNKHLKNAGEYLTGKAHPPVFEGSWVDDLKMVQTAHAIRLNNIPPMIQLKVVEEDKQVAGKDFFDPVRQEKLHDTPCSIGRVVRGGNYLRRMVVSAEDSYDLNKKPLTFHWVVLRGEAKRITIKRMNAAGSVVEIRVPYHERRKIDATTALESNRVDIGAFVHNGTYHSAPGFITFFSLDNEARTYDKNGRLLEIGHDAGDANLRIVDWKALFEMLADKGKSLPAQLVRKALTEQELAALVKAGAQYQPVHARWQAAQQKSQQAETARGKADSELKKADASLKAAQAAHKLKPSDVTLAALKQASAAQATATATRKTAEDLFLASRKDVDAAAKAAQDILGQKRADLKLPVQNLVEELFDKIKQNPVFYVQNRSALESLAKAAGPAQVASLQGARKRLSAMGLLQEKSGHVTIKALRRGSAPLAERLTRYEKDLLQRFHAEILSSLVYPKFLQYSFQVNFVDQRLATPIAWRDIYRYDASGNKLGWTRHDGTAAQDFNADGLLILEKDARGRALKARTVRYVLERTGGQPFPSLKQVEGKEIVYYEYKNADDLKGRIKKKEMVEEKK